MQKKNTANIQTILFILGILLVIVLAIGSQLKGRTLKKCEEETLTQQENITPELTVGWTETPDFKSDDTSAQKTFHIMTATDLHYISPELTDHGYYFQSITESADGKTMRYSEEIVDAFMVTVLNQKPDLLVLTGDMTFNGAKKSHEDFAAKLKILEQEGIPVLVIPGNHDLNSWSAVKFIEESYERVDNLSTAEFEELYADFGLAEAYSKDAASLSYVWECTPELRILMLDVNGVKKVNYVSEETLLWMEEQLKDAEAAGAKVISFSHQNLLQQSMFSDGYIIGNSGLVQRLYKQYGVKVNFAGHIHVQHIKEWSGLTEVVTSAMAIQPTHYADVWIDGSTLEYQTSSVDVAGWAEAQQHESKTLRRFDEYAVSFFRKTFRWQAYRQLALTVEDETLLQQMEDYYCDQNIAYFSGRLDEFPPDEEILAKWKELGSFTSVYLDSIASEGRRNMNHAVIELE